MPRRGIYSEAKLRLISKLAPLICVLFAPRGQITRIYAVNPFSFGGLKIQFGTFSLQMFGVCIEMQGKSLANVLESKGNLGKKGPDLGSLKLRNSCFLALFQAKMYVNRKMPIQNVGKNISNSVKNEIFSLILGLSSVK